MLSLPTKHVLKALLALGEHERGEYTSVSELSRAADLPSSYLSKLIKQLSEAEIVLTRKGPKGGVALPRRKISFFEVCEALEDPVVFDSCLLSRKACSKDSPCPLHPEWSKERKRIQGFLRRLRI